MNAHDQIKRAYQALIRLRPPHYPTTDTLADAVAALGSACWYCPACGVLYSRDEGATSAPPHPNPLEPDANCTGTPTAGLWIADDEAAR